MGKSKRKYRKNKKRTRKKRGGTDPPSIAEQTGNKSFQNEGGCVGVLSNNKDFNDKPTWIKYAIEGAHNRNVNKQDKINVRENWCGNTEKKIVGYCHNANQIATIPISNKVINRCLPGTKKGNKCDVELNLPDVYHCTRSCGHWEKDINKELIKRKKLETKKPCNTAKVKVDGKDIPIAMAYPAVQRAKEKFKKLLAKKKSDEKAKRKAEAKARKLAEAAAKKAEEERLRIAAEEAKREKERKRIALENKRAKEALEKKKADEKKKKACIKNMQKTLTNKFNTIKNQILRHGNKKYNNIRELFDDNDELFSNEGIKIVEDKIRLMNGINNDISEELDGCYAKISKNLNEESEKEFEKEWQRYENEIIDIVTNFTGVKVDLFEHHEKLYFTYTPANLTNNTQFAKLNPTNFKYPTKCRKKKVCSNELKKTIKKEKQLNNLPEFCIGSVVEGGIYPRSTNSYVGVIIGNAIERGHKKPKPLYPAVYWSPYWNYGSFPLYGLMYGAKKATTAQVKDFKTWYYKMLTRLGDKTPGVYPKNTLNRMINGMITKKGVNNAAKPTPQRVPLPFIEFLPCKQTGKAEDAYNKSRPDGLSCTGALACKKSKYQRSKPLCDSNTSCRWIGKKGGRKKRKRTRRKKKRKRRCTKKKR